MIKWCAFCQKFLGETQPLDDFSMTHGICGACLTSKAVSDAELIRRIKPISLYYRDLFSTGQSGDLRRSSELVARGLSLGLRPIDILVGIIQPALYEIGVLWATGKVSVADEHRFSSFCSVVIDLLYTKGRWASGLQQSKRPRLLLIGAPDNYHFLGLKVVEFYLLTAGVPVFTVYPGIPVEDVPPLVRKLQPEYVGMSVATTDQYKSVRDLCDELQGLAPELQPRPTLLVGGAALKLDAPRPEGIGVRYIASVSELESAVADTLGRNA